MNTKTKQRIKNDLSQSWMVSRDTRRMKLIEKIYQDAKSYSEVFCIVAAEGSGKSEPARLFADQQNVFLIKCKEHLNRKTFLADLLTAMGKNSGGYSVYEMMSAILETILSVENPIIIIDEADKISDPLLYFFITIYNETEDKCGIVLQATDHLKKRILKGVSMNKKGYKEMYSRIGRKFVELPANSQSELKRIAELNGVSDDFELNRIVNESEGDIRRVKRLVHAYHRKGGQAI